jgi:polar amino acid transport system permease protein
MQYSFYFAPVFSRVGELLQGTVYTLWLSAAVGFLGFLVGVLGALAQRSGIRTLQALVVGYVEAIRNTPLLAQLFFFYFGLAGLGLKLDAITAAVIAYVVNLGAYATEIVRSGVDAVPKGQTEAAKALGLRPWLVFRFVVFKPAIKVMFPALASQFTLLVLATSLVSQIGVHDLFYMATLIDSATYRSFEVYTVVCGFYLVLAICFRALFAILYRILFAERMRAAPVSGQGTA